MSGWSFLGDLGRMQGSAPMPFGRTDNTGALGMLVQALTRGMAGKGGQQVQQPDPEAEEAMARLLGLIPQQPVDQRWAALGMMGHR